MSASAAGPDFADADLAARNRIAELELATHKALKAYNGHNIHNMGDALRIAKPCLAASTAHTFRRHQKVSGPAKHGVVSPPALLMNLMNRIAVQLYSQAAIAMPLTTCLERSTFLT